MEKCKHRQTVLILKSRYVATVQEIKIDYWRDYLIGVECSDCGEKMTTPKLIIGPLYKGKPHYEAVTDEFKKIVNKEKSKKIRPLPEMGVC